MIDRTKKINYRINGCPSVGFASSTIKMTCWLPNIDDYHIIDAVDIDALYWSIMMNHLRDRARIVAAAMAVHPFALCLQGMKTNRQFKIFQRRHLMKLPRSPMFGRQVQHRIDDTATIAVHHASVCVLAHPEHPPTTASMTPRRCFEQIQTAQLLLFASSVDKTL